jgi:hypothetical protein
MAQWMAGQSLIPHPQIHAQVGLGDLMRLPNVVYINAADW